ncbi:MAG TPA: hypothetical protein DHW02_10310 [Ktedonobacter sp.]|nr:hypothetical protein [Ktedonobacter sp.]
MSDLNTSHVSDHMTLNIQPFRILESMHEAFLFLDTDWRIAYLNQQAAAILQHSREELLGTLLWNVFPEALKSTFCSHYLEAATTQQHVHFVELYSPLNIWVEFHVDPSPQGLAIYFLDVTQRIRTEEGLRSSEERFRAIWEQATDAMALSDPEGIVLQANPAYYQLYGYSPDQVIGKNFAVIYPEELREWARAEYVRTFHDSLIQPAIEAIIRRKDGTERVVESRYHFLFENGQRTAMVSTLRDITTQKREQEALQRLQVRAQRLMDSTIIGIIIANGDFIVEANDAFLELVGVTREQFKQHPISWAAITPSEYVSLDQSKLEELRTHGSCIPFEKEYLRPDGSRVPVLIGATLLQEEPLQWVCFVLDITAQKQLEQRKDDFIGIASHELRTPLTTLKALTQLGKRKIERLGTEDTAQLLTRMDAQINKLIKLVADLLDVSKIQAGKLDYATEDVALDEVVYESVETVQQVSSTHTITIHGTSNAHLVGDRDRLGQVFINLLNNAIKYSPRSTRVDVFLEATQAEGIIKIQDHGIGIPMEHKGKVFDRFYQVSDGRIASTPGLGMGLHISREIVTRHGGTISVESEEGIGTTFTVTLPLHHLSAQRENI